MKSYRIFICTDLEGPAGVNLWSQTREGDGEAKLQAMHLLTQELNAAVEGILEAAPGAEIVAIDGHGDGGLLYEEVHPAVRVMMKGVPDRPLWQNFNLRDYDCLMLVGQHAMEGTPNAPLCHTFSSRVIEHYKLNGQLIGETGMHAARFGEVGVPFVFLSGDDKACREAEALVPQVITVETKVGLGVQSAIHLSAVESRKRTREGARLAIERIKNIPAYRVPGPYEVEVRLKEGVSADNFVKSGKYSRVDDRTFVFKGDTLYHY